MARYRIEGTVVDTERPMATKTLHWEAGVWEPGMGMVVWSRHSTRDLAVRAAIRYARASRCQSGGMLTWSGSLDGGGVTWYDRRGAVRP